jgi:hypothetical protein
MPHIPPVLTQRNRLSNRRASTTFSFECNGLGYCNVPLDVIREALLRDPRGKASSPLGVALDLIAEGEQ